MIQVNSGHICGDRQGPSVPGSSGAGIPGQKGIAAGTAIPPGRWQGPHQGKVREGSTGRSWHERDEIQRAQLPHWSGHHSSTAGSWRCNGPDAWQVEEWSIQDLRQDTQGAASRILTTGRSRDC